MDTKDMVALSAAVIAALIALAKLVADKESRISDFRKDWIGGFREALAEMLGQAYTIAGRLRIHYQHAEACGHHDDQLSGTTDPVDKQAAPHGSRDPAIYKDLERELTTHWHELRKAHRAVLLHLNFYETSMPMWKKWSDSKQHQTSESVLQALEGSSEFKDLTQKQYTGKAPKNAAQFAVLLTEELENLVSKDRGVLGHYDEVGTNERYMQVMRSIDRATLLGNLVIKPEWNRIKHGERTYRRILRMTAAILCVGVTALVLASFWGRTTTNGVSPTLRDLYYLRLAE